MKILVTGGAGYIGSVLVPHLLAEFGSVTVIENFMYGNSLALAQCCNDPGFEVIRGDVRDGRVMAPLVKEHDVIIPLAAIVGAQACDYNMTATVTTNISAIHGIVSHLSPDQCIIAPISNSGYGVGSSEECTEDSLLNPVSEYGKSKVEAEKHVLDHKNGVSLRLATVFGMSPRMRRDLLVNDFVWRAVTDKAVVLFESHFRRNYVHVFDVARAFRHVICKVFLEDDYFGTPIGGPGIKMNPGVYNVGLSNANLTKRQLYEKIQKHVPNFIFMEAPIGEDPDKRDYVVSNAKIEGTGFKCLYGLDDGIKELIKGYQMMRREYSNV